MSTVPYLTQNYDPRTGLRKNYKGPQKTYQGPFTGSLGSLPPGQSFGGGYGGGQIPGGGPRGSITTAGFTPDYKSLIQQALAPLRAQLDAEGVSDATSANAALIRGLAQFGQQFDPASAQKAFGQDFYNQAGLGGLLDQGNLLAQQSTEAGVSFKARQNKELADTIRKIKNTLASRGLLRSGEAGYQLGEAQREYDVGSYDATQQLLDYFQGVQQGKVAADRARQTQFAAAQREEAPRQETLNPPTGERQLPYSGKSSADGRPLYGPDANGDYYYEDKTKYTPAPTSPSPVAPIGPAQTQPDPFAESLAALRRGRERNLGF